MVDCSTLELAKALAGPFVALVAAGGAWYFAHAQVAVAREQRKIAEMQARVADEKMRLELFNKRFEVYAACRDILFYITSGDERPFKTLTEKRFTISEATFFFDKDTCEKIDGSIMMIDAHFSASVSGDREILASTYGAAHDSLQALSDIFAPYLQFDAVSPGREMKLSKPMKAA